MRSHFYRVFTRNLVRHYFFATWAQKKNFWCLNEFRYFEDQKILSKHWWDLYISSLQKYLSPEITDPQKFNNLRSSLNYGELEMRWSFTFWRDVIGNASIYWFKGFLFRTSHSHMFFKLGVFKHFANSTGKQLCWSLFTIKMQDSGLQLFQKETPA